jgi:hypothetical protein
VSYFNEASRHDAENAAITRAALKSRAHPRDMDVRHLHQCAERRDQSVADDLHFTA